MTEDKKHVLKLTGTSNHAVAIINAARRAARDAGWDQNRIDALVKELTAGDYDHVLQVCMQHFDVR
jgi:hypothetical protein